MTPKSRCTCNWPASCAARSTIERGVPLVKTLTEQSGVAQGTAERALSVLREEGLIRSRMGRGHFVVRPASGGAS